MKHHLLAYQAFHRKLPCLIKLIASHIWADVNESSANSEEIFVSQAARHSIRMKLFEINFPFIAIFRGKLKLAEGVLKGGGKL